MMFSIPKSCKSTGLACHGNLRFIMERGAKACEIIVIGKIRAARAKRLRFREGPLISSGHPVNDYIDEAIRYVLLRQGVLGINAKIMQYHDPNASRGYGKGPKKQLPVNNYIVVSHCREDIWLLKSCHLKVIKSSLLSRVLSHDTVQAVQLGNRERLLAFCEAV